MIIPTLALILWIAAGCLGLAYVIEIRSQIDKQFARLETLDEAILADGDVAIKAKQAAEHAQKAIDEHLAWVASQRTANEKAARTAPKPRRGHDR